MVRTLHPRRRPPIDVQPKPLPDTSDLLPPPAPESIYEAPTEETLPREIAPSLALVRVPATVSKYWGLDREPPREGAIAIPAGSDLDRTLVELLQSGVARTGDDEWKVGDLVGGREAYYLLIRDRREAQLKLRRIAVGSDEHRLVVRPEMVIQALERGERLGDIVGGFHTHPAGDGAAASLEDEVASALLARSLPRGYRDFVVGRGADGTVAIAEIVPDRQIELVGREEPPFHARQRGDRAVQFPSHRAAEEQLRSLQIKQSHNPRAVHSTAKSRKQAEYALRQIRSARDLESYDDDDDDGQTGGGLPVAPLLLVGAVGVLALLGYASASSEPPPATEADPAEANLRRSDSPGANGWSYGDTTLRREGGRYTVTRSTPRQPLESLPTWREAVLAARRRSENGERVTVRANDRTGEFDLVRE